MKARGMLSAVFGLLVGICAAVAVSLSGLDRPFLWGAAVAVGTYSALWVALALTEKRMEARYRKVLSALAEPICFEAEGIARLSRDARHIRICGTKNRMMLLSYDKRPFLREEVAKTDIAGIRLASPLQLILIRRDGRAYVFDLPQAEDFARRLAEWMNEPETED